MGRAARLNPRSRDGGKPPAFASLHRLWRAAGVFGDDYAAFDKWASHPSITPDMRAKLEKLWTERHPAPMVSLA